MSLVSCEIKDIKVHAYFLLDTRFLVILKTSELIKRRENFKKWEIHRNEILLALLYNIYDIKNKMSNMMT